MDYSETALKVYKKLYFRPGDENSTHNVHARVARFASTGDSMLEKRLTKWMDEGYMRPNTPTLMNAGYLPNPQSSACFVGSLEDDLKSILNFDMEAGLIYNRGSGIGGNYGNLREIGAPLSRGGQSSGPFAFLRKHAMTGWAIKSGGASRRAAAMGMMYDWHPDILEWIEWKAKNKDRIVINNEEVSLFDGVNLSVAASDKFMLAAVNGWNWDLRGVVDGEVKKSVNASDMLMMMAENACKCGDPGIWFIDLANKDNTIPSLGRYESTNPCGEQALLPKQSCALASINLAKFVETQDGVRSFDFMTFCRVIDDTVTMQDNLINISGYPTPEYKTRAIESRPIGMGIMGLADSLILLGIPYDSLEAYGFAASIAKCLTAQVIDRSSWLAIERGVFDDFHENKDDVLRVASKFADGETMFKRADITGLRNSQWTTIAPTGSISISADCSQGMEPLFAICYGKRISDSDEVWSFVNPIFKNLYEKEKWYAKALEEVAENHGSCQGCKSVPKDIQRIFKTAHDIGWKDRIKMQASLQAWISNSISSTINLPFGTSPDVVKDIYVEAWRSGLKGITVYVDGCKENQPVVFGGGSKKAGADETVEKESPLKRGEIVERPKILDGSTACYRVGCGKIYVTVNGLCGVPMEVFPNPGTKGGCQANIRALGIIISKAIRAGVDPKLIENDLSEISCPACRGKDVDAKSCPAAIAKAMADAKPQDSYFDWYDRDEPFSSRCSDGIHCGEDEPERVDIGRNLCPDCGCEIAAIEGCFTCMSCGFSKCS